ncbi:hypothetical protein ES703_53225 [subsurface metagenome]
MVRLKVMPQQAIVDYWKGIVDFYYCMGIPCARKWPHWPKRVSYPLEKANQDSFAYAAQAWKNLPEYVKLLYQDMAAGIGLNRRDLFMRSYLNGNPF